MSALSYFLEREGLLTTGISLVRENTVSMQPPRALWVPFPLGRPLGKPGDAAFQHAVIRSALGLLEHRSGPVLEDYPVDAPAEVAAMVCPVSFAAADAPERDTWRARLLAELETLTPWYEMSLRRRGGRTLVGVAAETPEQNLETLAGYLDVGIRPHDIRWLKRAFEDLKALYLEAMTAQPGDYDRAAIQQQFWRETQLGAGILTIYHQFQDDADPRLQMVARMLAPRDAVGVATGPGERANE